MSSGETCPATCDPTLQLEEGQSDGPEGGEAPARKRRLNLAAYRRRRRKPRDRHSIRALFFAALLSSMFFLIALAIRDFITETVYSLAPREKLIPRLVSFGSVVAVAVLIVIVVYVMELDR